MYERDITSGLHAVTRAEINYAALPIERLPKTRHWHGYWPDEKTNRELKNALCAGCNPERCANMPKCRFGAEAQRRVDAGEMEPCYNIRKREVPA